jgi:hypothetical protein
MVYTLLVHGKYRGGALEIHFDYIDMFSLLIHNRYLDTSICSYDQAVGLINFPGHGQSYQEPPPSKFEDVKRQS